MSRVTMLFVVAALAWGCSDAGVASSNAVVRDSAGVRIVETPGDVWNTPVRWSVSAEPVVRIGAVDGDPAYLFDRIGGLALLSDGRVVVANAGNQTIRWYGPDGRFLFERGGTGKGPGEFSSLGELTVLEGDTVVAVDAHSRRLTLFGPDGTLSGTVRIDGMTAVPGRAHQTSTGEWIVSAGDGYSTAQAGGRLEPGVHRFDSPVLRIARDGAQIDTIGQFASTEIEARPYSGGTIFLPALFARRLHYAVVSDGVLIATGDRMQFDVYSLSGEHVRSVRAPDVDVTLTPAMLAAYQDRARERAAKSSADRLAAVERSIAETKYTDSLPAYSSVIVDDDGNTWLGEFRFHYEPAEQFLVFDKEGRLSGRASVPAGFRVMAIRDGRLWGQTKDEFGVEYVVAHTLEEHPDDRNE